MKILIFKLGILIFALLVLVGGYLDLPLFTILFRSFVVFLIIETMLVLMAVVYIKTTENLRIEHEEEYSEKE